MHISFWMYDILCASLDKLSQLDWRGGRNLKLSSVGEHRSIYVHYSEIKSDINDLMYLVSVPLPLSPSLLPLSLLTYSPKLIMALSVTFSIIESSS